MISDYMQAIKTQVDELAALGKLLDYEDLIEKILEGLYQSLQIQPIPGLLLATTKITPHDPLGTLL